MPNRRHEARRSPCQDAALEPVCVSRSEEIRPMTSAGYLAPWFRMPRYGEGLPRPLYDGLSPRGQQLCRFLVLPGPV